MQVKLCKKCNTTKPASEFSVVKTTYKGVVSYYLQSGCKPCIRAHWKAHKATYKPQVRKAKRSPLTPDELNDMKSPIWWEAMKGHTTLEKHKIYPLHACGRRYLSELGCIWCNRILNVTQTH